MLILRQSACYHTATRPGSYSLPVPERRVHPSQDAAESGRCATNHRGFRRAFQRRSPAECDRLRRARGQVGRSRAGDLRRAGPQARCGAGPEASCSRGGSNRGRIVPDQVVAESSRGTTKTDGLGGGEGTVATRPERRPRGQDRRGAARCRPVFPLWDWYEALNRAICSASTLHFIFRPRSLHFTLNHYLCFRVLKECLTGIND